LYTCKVALLIKNRLFLRFKHICRLVDIVGRGHCPLVLKSMPTPDQYYHDANR